MEKYKLLSGDEIVAKGITKINTSLPEVGLKDVVPNGSWLEQKQIQAALEARKNLIEVGRIEKCGALSHAEWRQALNLAEVTQKTGGHWQYLGHHMDKKLYLKPEEALFLMEVNCLLLKHAGVTVSLQKAYSLLLKDTESILQYRVYSSLSRLGYKVFRHITVDNKTKYAENHKICSKSSVIETNVIDKENLLTEEKHNQNEAKIMNTLESIENVSESSEDVVKPKRSQEEIVETAVSDDRVEVKNAEMKTEMGTRLDVDINENREAQCQETNCEMNIETDASNSEMLRQEIKDQPDAGVIDNINSDKSEDLKKYVQPYNIIELTNLRNRNLKPTDVHILHKNFENVPELCQKQIVTINVPPQDFLPKNVFVNKSCYVLNLFNITSKTVRSTSRRSSYSLNDEVNESHVRQIRSSSSVECQQNIPSQSFPGQNFNYRQYNFWRPPSSNFYHFGMFFQRPCMPNMYFMPRFPYHQRPFIRPVFNVTNPNCDSNHGRKRRRGSLKSSQLRGIKVLAAKLKLLIISGNTQVQNIESLQSLLHTYNMKYKTRLRLTEHFDVVNDETVIATIELDDEEESKSKKPRPNEDDKYTDNINRLKQLALKLKDLESRNKANARHRRAFSNAIKTFNKCYHSDVHINSNYEIVDRSYINLDSSSESDCVIEELSSNEKPLTKKLKNPFNILKRLSERFDVNNIATCSKDHVMEIDRKESEQNISYSEHLKQTFNQSWLPNENDFGRAEVISYIKQRDSYKVEHLLGFIKDQPERYENWLELKLAFYKYVAETAIAFSKEQTHLQSDAEHINSGLQPLLIENNGLDIPSVLEKLRIIRNNQDICNESVLTIDFDVYNRDVQNFRKTNPPKPHFRLICISETASFPSASDISALYANYDDNVPIVFSIVGTASISYLQINPIDLPVYIPNTDLEL